MKAIKQHYQNLIIGFGKGGKTLAAYLAKHGQEVVLIEKSEKMYGGTCINIGCIPTKALIVSAERKVPYVIAHDKKDKLTALLRAKNLESLENLDLASVITGEASFVSPSEVLVKLNNSVSDIQIQADRIFINTGTLPFIPPIPGLESSKKVFTSTSIMEQSVLPARLAIVGAGFIGLEFADMYSKFGGEVVLLNSEKMFLPHEDKDIADEIFKVLSAKGIHIANDVKIESVQDIDNDLVRVNYIDGGKLIQLDVNAVLVATGRKPNIDTLNVAAAGVKLDERGYIAVDDSLKTNQPHIWAIGDVNGGPQFTYISLDDFRIIRDQIFGGDYTSIAERKQVAFSVFISPPLAHIGLREWEAIEKGYKIKVGKLPAIAIPRARILNETNGILKTIVDTETNRILGCTLFCADSSEMINTVQIAINAGLDFKILRDTIYTHPSMTEALNDLYTLI
ncbi:MAG: FAD-dependent oxidoreductase [Candidatus Pedobacter colombiensis]|uniref:FAD-dependent oxidoreductase n=1 Tax=Candidatus Pedobacter colombiensis TaxID=3121371 RepID=A0AAJ5WC28_9SPHI|nr:FAD-dependent oxidoreductase [Pedobacter sp.]WEK21729.1 MAG: FAD-dependent oxidoreductase [Pedobacter sp.]